MAEKKTSFLKFLGIGCGLLVVGGTCVAGTCAAFVNKGENGTESSAATSASSGGSERANALPWVQAVRGNCDRYKAARNDIQKSAIFNENEAQIKGIQLESVKGKLTQLRTAQGGGGLILEVEAASAEFKNGIFEGIPQDSPVYQSAANLAEGDCVVFSATITGAASVVEQSKVCDLDYNVEWSAIAPCGS